MLYICSVARHAYTLIVAYLRPNHYLVEEIENCPSVFKHEERDIIVLVHVDDPLVRTTSEEDEDWFYTELAKRLKIKDPTRLDEDNELDYLSLSIRMNQKGNVYLSNQGTCTETVTVMTKDPQMQGKLGVPSSADLEAVHSQIPKEHGLVMTEHRVKVGWVKQLKSGRVNVNYIRTDENPADHFTKLTSSTQQKEWLDRYMAKPHD